MEYVRLLSELFKSMPWLWLPTGYIGLLALLALRRMGSDKRSAPASMVRALTNGRR